MLPTQGARFTKALRAEAAGEEVTGQRARGAATGTPSWEGQPRSSSSSGGAASARRRLAFEPRSVVFSFKGLPPWQAGLPVDYRGGKRGFPFSVHWRGPWALIDNPLRDATLIRRGRWVAELQGPVGTVQFGRPVHLQAIDLARPMNHSCAGVPPRPPVTSSSVPLPPLVLRGKRGGEEVFTEVIPLWELSQFVNGVAFAALTSSELVDSVSFISSECIMVAAIQATFGVSAAQSAQGLANADLAAFQEEQQEDLAEELREAGLDDAAAEAEAIRATAGLGGGAAGTAGAGSVGGAQAAARGGGNTARRPGAVPGGTAEQREMLTMRGGWRAYGFEDVEFRLSSMLGDAPTWSLNDVASQRLTLRPTVFEEPPRLPQDNLLEEPLQGVGPEPIAMPAGFEEVLDAGPETDGMEPVMREQRNSTVIMALAQALTEGAKAAMTAFLTEQEARMEAGLPLPPEQEWQVEATLLEGLPRIEVNRDLAQLLSGLLQASEAESPFVANVRNQQEAFDLVWRSVAPDYLDCVLVRWRNRQVPSDADGKAGAETTQASPPTTPSTAAGETAVDPADALRDTRQADNVASRKAFRLPPPVVRGENVTRILINAIVLADQAVAFRVNANNAKLRTSAKSALEKLGMNMKKASSIQVEFVTGSADPSGTVQFSNNAASMMKMKPADVMALLKAMNPSEDAHAKSEQAEVDEWGD